MKKYDVAVIGGGFAGFAAALSAARGGASVLIIEKANCLGGSSVNCLVTPFMPHWKVENDEKVRLAKGIFEEIHNKLEERGAMRGESFSEEELKFLLNDMAEEAGIDLLYHAYIFKAHKDGDKIKAVSLATRRGELQVQADYFIDATGDAQLAYLAGCPTVLGRESDNLCQPMTLCFRLGNVDVETFYEHRDKLNEIYKEHLVAGKFINPRENILVFKTPTKNVLHFNTTRVVKKNPTDPFDFTQAEIIARKQVRETYEFVKKYGKGLENSFLMSTAAEIGVRESRKIVGDYVLTEDDCKNLTKFDDAVSVSNYMIDIHNPEGTGTSRYYFPNGEYYTIPYRSLIPQGVDNLLVAGRCISSDHSAQASYRIMPFVACIGEAAGTATALAVKDKIGVRQVDIRQLQKTLKENGAFIGI